MRLKDIASVIRSKNSGPFELTLDLLFPDDATYQAVVDAGIITEDLIASLYHLRREDVLGVLLFPRARAIKATIVRPMASGAIGERDVYGAQQHAPLMELDLKEEDFHEL